MQEAMPRKEQTEKSEASMPRELAEQIEFDSLRDELRRMPTDLFDVKPDHSPARREELLAMRESAARAYKNLWELGQKIGPKSQEHQFVKRLLGPSGESGPVSRLNSNLSAFIEFGEKLSQGKIVDEVERGFMVAALRDASAQAQAVIRELESIPIQSVIRSKIGPTVKKTIRMLAVLVSLGFLKGQTPEASGQVRIEHAQKQVREKIKKHGLLESTEGKYDESKSGAGEKMQRGTRHKKKPGMALEPNIYSSEGNRPGEFGQGRPFAEIDFSIFNDIDDPLWVDSISARDSEGDFRVIEQKVESVGNDVEAKVAITRSMQVNKDDEIALYAPVGFTVSDVKVEPNIPFELDQNSRSIVFNESSGDDEVQISYNVVSSNDTFVIPESNPQNLNRTPDQFAVMEKLKGASDDDIEDLLDEHLSQFTYVTSNDLQELLEKMPGSNEEKTGALKIGDCDVLSMYAAGLLDDAGKTGLVAGGFLENNDGIDAARAHAKLVYITKDGRAVSYESTAPVEEAYVNLKFADEDEAVLEESVSKMSEDDAPEARLQKYEDFRQKLSQILEKGKYDEYKHKELFEAFGNIFEKLEQMIKRGGEFGPEVLVAITAEIAIILALAGTVLGARAGLLRLGRKSKHELDEEALALVKRKLKVVEGGKDDEKEKTREYKEEEGRVIEVIKDVYRKNQNLEDLYPLDEVLKLPLGQKRNLLVIFTSAELIFSQMYGEGALDFFRGIEARADWQKAVSRLEAEGLPVGKLFQKIREVITDPKLKAEYEKNIPKKVAAIVSKGAELGTRVSNSLRKSAVKVTNKRVLQAFGVEQLGGDVKSRRRRTTVAPGEFYDYAPYQPGMDIKTIDWRLYARTDKLMVRRSIEEVRGKEPKFNFDLVIDVDSVEDSDLEHLSAMILYLQQNPGNINMETISFIAYSEVLDRFDQKVTEKLLSRAGGGNVSSLIEKIERLKLDHSMREFARKSVKKRWRYGQGINALEAAGWALRPEGLARQKDYLYLGARPFSQKSKQYYSVFTFAVPREEEEKAA